MTTRLVSTVHFTSKCEPVLMRRSEPSLNAPAHATSELYKMAPPAAGQYLPNVVQVDGNKVGDGREAGERLDDGKEAAVGQTGRGEGDDLRVAKV